MGDEAQRKSVNIAASAGTRTKGIVFALMPEALPVVCCTWSAVVPSESGTVQISTNTLSVLRRLCEDGLTIVFLLLTLCTKVRESVV